MVPGQRQDGRLTRRSRVRWLAPSVLAMSVRPVVLSGLFARYSDRREVEAVIDQGVVYRSATDELWVDYVADTGDGFDATATVASLLAPERLTVGASETQAGSLLVFGGDEVYPFASMDEYRERLLKPFEAMLPFAHPDHPREVVAVPGNHDWYDGLTAFLQVFCSRQWFGGWRSKQRRSYFACQLPHGWWLWGIDIQLDTYIDQPQLEYFQKVAEEVKAGDSIILCWAKPAWVKAAEDGQPPGAGIPATPAATAAAKPAEDRPKDLEAVPLAYRTLDYFQRHVIPAGVQVRLSLTGDSHHYARYLGPDGEQKVTAGIGGAFLSATHHLPDDLLLPSRTKGHPPVSFCRKWEYPSCDESKRLSWGVLRSIYANGGFVALPASAYAALALASTRRRRPGVATACTAAAVVAGCVAFSKEKRPRDWPLGIGHGLTHVAVSLGAAGCVGTGGRRRAGVVLGTAATGLSVGPALFALYLLIADRTGQFGRNTNELFAALAIEDYKGFLRLHFRPDGGLTVYPVKVDRVTRWEPDPDSDGYRPARNGARPIPTLIEEPFEVTPTP